MDTSRSLVQFLSCGGRGLLLALLLAAACSRAKPPEISEIRATSGNTIAVNATASLTIDSSGSDLQFKWEAERGKISNPTAPSILYTAPDSPGPDVVTVRVSGAGGTSTKSKPFDVVASTETPHDRGSEKGGFVTLSDLRDGSTVPCEVSVKGRYSPDIKDFIWPVVWVGGRFHPQDSDGRAAPKVNGTWFGTVHFGDCRQPQKDTGKTFQLFVVTVGPEGNKEFEDYLAECRRTGNYLGVPKMPRGTTTYLEFTLTRE